MKPYAYLTPMLILLLHSYSYSQQAYKLEPPRTADKADGRLFHFSSSKQFSESDTGTKILHITIASKNVISYKVTMEHDSTRSVIRVLDSLIHDSALYSSALATDTVIANNEFKIVVVASDKINTQFPVENVYQTRPRTKIVGITYTNPLDSIKKSKPIKLSGSIQTIGQVSEDKLPYQTIPQNYVRTSTQLNADVFGLPFSTGYYHTTEGNQGLNKINNFRLSFNYQQFYSNVRTRLDKKIELGKMKQLKSMTPIDITALNDEYNKLRNELLSKDYQKKLLRNQQVLDYAVKDTSFKQSYRYKKALAKQELNTSKLDKLKQLERLKEEYLKYSKLADFDAKIATFNLDKPKDFRKAAKRYKITKPSQNIFLSIRKLDLGTFDPDYTVLVLSGVSLTGVNVEVNPGKLYGAFTWGKAVANFDNPLNLSAIAGGRNIIAGRVGYGSKDNLLIAVSILKGTDDSGNSVKDSFYDYYLPNNNYVLGIDATYKISPSAEVGAEYAKSQNVSIGPETPSPASEIRSVATPNRDRYSSAFCAYTSVQFNQNTTKLKFSTRIVDPFYYSFGTPYLRKDNFRIEAKGEQSFWKRQFSMGLTYRRDADNIYELKQGTSTTNTFLYNATLRIKKYPYLMVLYSPNYQSLFNASFNNQITTQVKFYNVIVGYTASTKKVMSNTMVSFTKQYNNSNQPEWKRYHVNQYALSQSVQLKPVYLTLTGAANYSLPILSNDTGKAIGASMSATKGLLKNKLSVTIGARYQKDLLLEERLIAEVGSSFTLGFGIQCQVQLERHFVTPYTETGSSKDMTLGRITIIKTFSYE